MVDPLSESGKTFYLETEYQCRVCGDMFFSAKSLREHVADRHCEIDDYVERHGELETRAVFHTCAICSQVREHPDMMSASEGEGGSEKRGRIKGGCVI